MSNLYKNGFLYINGRNRHRRVCDQRLRFAGVGIAVRDSASRNTRRDLLYVAARSSASASLEPQVRFAVPRALLGLIAVLTFVGTAFFLPSPLAVRVEAADVPFIDTLSLPVNSGTYCEPSQPWGVCSFTFTSSSTATTTLDYITVYTSAQESFTPATSTIRRLQVYVYRVPSFSATVQYTGIPAPLVTLSSLVSIPFNPVGAPPPTRFALRPVVLDRNATYAVLFRYSDDFSLDDRISFGFNNTSTSTHNMGYSGFVRYTQHTDTATFYDTFYSSTPVLALGYSGAEGFALPPIYDTSLGAESALERNGCYDLSLTDLYGAAKCAVIWAFFPTEEVNDRWLQLRTSLTNAWPLGYAFQVYDARIAASSTSATSSVVIAPTWSSFPTAGAVGHMPAGSIELFSWSKIVTAFSSPFLSYASYLLQVLMWLAFASFLYHFFVVSSTHVHPDKTS